MYSSLLSRDELLFLALRKSVLVVVVCTKAGHQW